jgi:uncharacterized membrane protein YphA (DoxX/SURF4 family)
LAIVMLVVLRITIGWHFLYEGVWKIANAEEFSAKPFLGMAKGPAAELYYAMLPDLDGSERLVVKEFVDEGILDELQDSQIKMYAPEEETYDKLSTFNDNYKSEFKARLPKITLPVYEQAWDKYKEKFLNKHELEEDQKKKVERIYWQYLLSLREFADKYGEDMTAKIKSEIEQHFGSLERFREQVASKTNEAPHQLKRNWDRRMELRAEAEEMLDKLETMGDDYQMALWDVLTDKQKKQSNMGDIVYEPNRLPVPVPFVKSHMGFLDWSVTLGLTAIGFCVVIGFCTRLALIGGAIFLINVLLTQPPWPTIYPHAPPVVGHAMIVDKNFVEMVAMFALATIPVGRWAGLDYFLYHLGGKKLAVKYGLEDPEPEEQKS